MLQAVKHGSALNPAALPRNAVDCRSAEQV